MLQSFSRASIRLVLSLSILSNLALGYRPVQFVKHTGDNGRADQAFAITHYYNETTQQSDLYVRMEAFRYDSSNKGWAALAFGQEMAGALMFIIYGDPSAPGSPLTLTVRTIDSHHPPRPLAEMDFYSGPTPQVDVTYTHFDEYTGSFYHEVLKKKPSHLGVAEFIVRGFTSWTACDVSNSTNKQAFIWSSNFKQDFEGDYSEERHIDMHQFGLGFGFLWVDILNAQIDKPMFGPINDLESHKGINEIGDPPEPTQEELDNGEAYVASHDAFSSNKDTANTTPDIVTDLPSPTTAEAEAESTPTATAEAVDQPPQPTTSLNPNPDLEAPVHSHKQSSLRNWMWHLHGLLMVSAFLLAYPLGIYFLRSSRPTAFNLHWTTQALGSIGVLIGAILGYWQSHSISVLHQYIGLVVAVVVALQVLAGWRHHITFLQVKRTTWITTCHKWAGRGLLPVGMLNIFSGLYLRGYGWFVMGITLVVMLVELLALFIYVRRTGRSAVGVRLNQQGHRVNQGAKGVSMTDEEAEEYFQLAGDDDDDEFSDSDHDNDAEGMGKGKGKGKGASDEEERQKAERLRRLDRV